MRKKMRWIFPATLLVATLLYADTTTTRFGMTKPDVGSANWGPKLNTNFDTIDNAAGVNLNNVFTATNTYSANQTYSAQILGGNGTTASPTYSWTSFTGSGWLAVAGPVFDFVVTGSTQISIASTGVTITTITATSILNGFGSQAAPSYSFSGLTGYGMYSNGSTQVNLVTNGQKAIVMDSGGSLNFYGSGQNLVQISSDNSNGPLVFPVTDNVLPLGRAANRWSDFRSVNAQISIATVTTLSLGGSLNAQSNKLINVTSGTASTDAATFGQLNTWSAVTSSNTTSDIINSGGTNFSTTSVGVSFALKTATDHVAIICTGQVRSNAAGGSVVCALYRDTTNLDDPTVGQATHLFDENEAKGNITILGYDAPGDTSTHLYRVWIKTNGTGTAHYGDGATARCLAWETP